MYIFNYILNLLSLSQFKVIGVFYYNKNNYIILKRSNKKVVSIKQNWYLFILKLIIKPNLAIFASDYKKSTYFKTSMNI